MDVTTLHVWEEQFTVFRDSFGHIGEVLSIFQTGCCTIWNQRKSVQKHLRRLHSVCKTYGVNGQDMSTLGFKVYMHYIIINKYRKQLTIMSFVCVIDVALAEWHFLHISWRKSLKCYDSLRPLLLCLLQCLYTSCKPSVFQESIRIQEKKEKISLSPMTKAHTPTEMWKGQSDNTNNATKSSISQRSTFNSRVLYCREKWESSEGFSKCIVRKNNDKFGKRICRIK